VLDWIKASGYGLTFGIHTRVGGRAERVARALHVGNVYVNRNTIGAIVGSQPFGGMGLSGTGPKAGGPNYLQRFALEQVVSTDTTAAGGNASLVTMEDEGGS
jgi:RHH-type proline utilization regulon transcriptional repressor/proline dehydrogenase/delta 1-pyrroline-5-carboxylate dehydrogenase